MGPSLIAIFVALIAWQQWQLSKATLREKLFERRMQVFSQLRDVLSEAMRSGTLEQNELNRLRDTINAARFLFGSEINSWLDEMFQKAIILKHLTEVFNNHIDGDTAMETSQLDKKAEAFQFLVSQFEELFPKFEPYLKFDHRN